MFEGLSVLANVFILDEIFSLNFSSFVSVRFSCVVKGSIEFDVELKTIVNKSVVAISL